MSKPKIIIFGDPCREHAFEAMQRFVGFSCGKVELLANCFDGQCAIDTLREADLAVVFGGDWTILGAARELCETDVPVVGVNVGKLGFLAEFSIAELEEQFDRIISDKVVFEKRLIMDCSIVRDGERVFSYTAVNDVVLTAGQPFNIIEAEITVENQILAGCIGDGLIVSTPTGSTAYNLSAGGPILAGNLSAMVITPVCPHSLSFRRIVINAANKFDIKMILLNEQSTVMLDGQVQRIVKVGDVVTIKRHNGSFKVVNNPNRTQWDTLAKKLHWAQKPHYNSQESRNPGIQELKN